MLLTHVSVQHSGEAIGAQARVAFSALGRGMCCTEGCGALRDLTVARCRKCRRNAAVRALAENDVVPANSSRAETPLSQQASAADEVAAADAANAAEAPPPVPVVEHELPADFLSRVQGLSSQTILHIPRQFRQQLCSITASCVEGCNAGDASSAVLEQARSKLLLAHIPKGGSTLLELRTRLELWQQGSFVTLLERVSAQAQAATTSRSSAPPQQLLDRGARARRLAQGGAYRKSVQSLQSKTAVLDANQQRHWAVQLLPETAREDQGVDALAQPLPAAPAAPEPAAESQEVPKPLDGVHFSRLSGPGPTGMRPEHLKDMLACARRRAVNRLLRAIHAFESMAVDGTLPGVWKFILHSRLVFIAKKHGPVPRPIRVGEFWRRVVAKHALHQQGNRVRRSMLDVHQYGVSIPGGADILIHTRSILEECLRQGPATGVWAILDVDFVNAFPSFEWGSIESAMQSRMPELSAWTRWCHASPGDIFLPGGEVHRARRGAEQGDPHGSLQCGVVLADVAEEAMAEFCRRKATDLPGCFAAWYCDDGQVICRPADADLYLQCLDAAAARVGATRGAGPAVKTRVRLVGHPAALAAFHEPWLSEHIRQTCQLGEPNEATEVLGTLVGSAAAQDAHFFERSVASDQLRSSLAEVADPAVVADARTALC
jgi:hypothetical protein